MVQLWQTPKMYAGLLVVMLTVLQTSDGLFWLSCLTKVDPPPPTPQPPPPPPPPPKLQVPNLQELQGELRSKLYGQHLVIDTLVSVLQNHVKKHNPSKALALSFHGSTGTGKTFVTQIMAKHFFDEGTKSKYFHLIHSRVLLSGGESDETVKRFLINIVKKGSSSFQPSIFVFDEVNLLPSGTLDALSPFLDYHDHIDGRDYRKNIFIFLSNTGAEMITDAAFRVAKEGKSRESVTLMDSQSSLRQAAHKLKGGFQGSNVIERNMIDYFFPFLPLERRHVELCVRDILQANDIFNPDLIDIIVDQVEFDKEWDELYSTIGCRGLEKIVEQELSDTNFGHKNEKSQKSQK